MDLRLLLISAVLLAEPILPNTGMIILIAIATILCLLATQRREQAVVRRAICQMKREIIAAVVRPREQ